MTEKRIKKGIVPLKRGIFVRKPINCEVSIGDYLVYDKEKIGDFYFNLEYAQKNNIVWKPKQIKGYVADNLENYSPNNYKEFIIMVEMRNDDLKKELVIRDLDKEEEQDKV